MIENFSPYLLPIVVVFLAVFTQSAAGFGVALVAMSLLPGLLGIKVAAPLVAVLALALEIVLLIRYREHLNFRAVAPIILASAIATPIGVYALKNVAEALVMRCLGVVLAAFGLYNLFKIRLPELRHPLWAWLVGLIAGLIGGAYNTSGPPVIIYGHCRRWQPAEFKSNLQGFFVLNSLFVVGNHLVSRNLTPEIWTYFLYSLPALVAGIIAGALLERRLNPSAFRQLVLALLIIMGIKLIITG